MKEKSWISHVAQSRLVQPKSMQPKVVAGVCGSIALFCANLAFAQSLGPLDPVEELFRFGQQDHLIIDRGGPVDYLGDVNGDGFDDIVVGSGIGGVRVVFGPTNGNNGTLSAAQIRGDLGFNIAHDSVNLSHVSAVGDVNGDGLDDILVGSLGGAHVVFGSSAGFPSSFEANDFNGTNGFSFDSPATYVSDAGDVNGDGLVDIIVGNSTAGANGLSAAGVSYIVYGSRISFPASLQPSDLNGNNGFAILGTNTEDRSGHFVGAAGDFNHDGVDDFMIGAPNKTQGSNAEVGEAYVLYGRSAGFPAAISLSDVNGQNGFVFKGSNIQDLAGSAVTGIGDLNHDGIDDIAISAPGKGPFGSPSDYPGEVYVMFGGSFDGIAEVNEQSLNGTNGFVARGIRGGVVPVEVDEAIWGDLAGTSVDGAGDFNNDGVDDLLIGASHTIINPRRKGVGQIYVIYGSTAAFPARFNLSDLDGDNGFRINGIGTVDYFGVYARKAGDFNADGGNDIVVGASGQGNTYVIYGRQPWMAVQEPPAPISFRSASSPGFLPIAFNAMPNADVLFFRELDDPTGPTPLPTSVSTILGSTATPGNILPNILAPVEPVRPGGTIQAVVETQPLGQTPVSIPESTPVTTVVEQTVPVDGNPTQTLPTEVANSNDVVVGPNVVNTVAINAPVIDTQSPVQLVRTGGGAFWALSLVLCVLLRLRRG